MSPWSFRWTAALFSFLWLLRLEESFAFSNDRSDNLAVYWGQDSAGNQQRLSFYCEDDMIDAIPLAFLYILFGEGGRPVIDFANTCNQWDDRTFSGTNLADCSFLEPDIQQCQARGKIVTLSIGGATGKVGFSSDAQATTFAQTVWDMFLGGNSDTRPFGSAILDGVDLDIESGSSAHYAAFVNKIRSLSKGAAKRYYVTAAPQCPFPDANLGAALNNAVFDAVYVQFYNNYCATSVPNEFNFETWDQWARNVSPNKNVKVYLGAPAAPKAAGQGYVNVATLLGVALNAQTQYPSFGGVMLWDADEAYTNGRYDKTVKNALTKASPPRPASPPPETGPPTTFSPVPVPVPAPAPDPPSPEPPTTGAFPSSSEPAVSVSFRDPLATARVKRPSLLLPTPDN